MSSIWTKINRYFGTFWDISTFKLTFYSILDAECSTHYMQRRKKTGASKLANIYTISPKINRYFGTLWDTSTFKRTFYSILDAERTARGFQLRIKPSDPKFATTSSILTKINLCIDIFCDISTFKGTYNSILHVACSALYMQCGNKPSGSPIWKHLTDFTEN